LLNTLVLTACLIYLFAVYDHMTGDKFDSHIKSWLHGGDDLPVESMHSVAKVAAQAADSYLSKYLGEKFFSWDTVYKTAKFWLRISLLTTIVVLAITALMGGFSETLKEMHGTMTILSLRIAIITFGVFFGSILSLLATRLLLRFAKDAHRTEVVWGCILLQIVVAYVSIVVAMNVTFSTTALADGLLVGYFFDTLFSGHPLAALVEVARAWRNFFLSYTVEMFVDPIESGRRLSFGGSNLLYYSIPAAWPGLIYFLALSLTWLLRTAAFVRTPKIVWIFLDGMSNGNRPALVKVYNLLKGLLALMGEAVPAIDISLEPPHDGKP